MTKDEMGKMTGVDLLCMIARNMGGCHGTFTDPFTVEQLIQIGKMHLLSDWDIHPDQWTRNERPKYTPRPKVQPGTGLRTLRGRR